MTVALPSEVYYLKGFLGIKNTEFEEKFGILVQQVGEQFGRMKTNGFSYFIYSNINRNYAKK